MNFFNKNILKIKTKSEGENISFYIDYYNLKKVHNFKVNLLERLINDNTCLAIIDTRLLYDKFNSKINNKLNELISILKGFNIEYKNITLESPQEMTLLGFKLTNRAKKDHQNYMLGFIIKKEVIKNIEHIFDNYDLHYYITCSKYSNGDIFNRLRPNYIDDSNFNDIFKYDIFDSCFIKRIVIHSKAKNYESIKNIIDDLNQF